MLSTRIDRSRLKCSILALGTECSEIKRVLRARWTRPMADDQKRLCRLRRNLTELHILSAWTRGRLHVTSKPGAVDWDARTHAAAIAERLAPDYACAVTAIPPATSEIRP